MMAALGGVGGGGATMWVAIRARDQTGEAFNKVDSSMRKLQSTAISTMNRVGSLAMSFATLGRITGILNDEQARMIGVVGTVIHIFGILGSVVKALTAIDWAHVAALTWKVALMTLGVGVAIAAASAMAILALQTNKATESQKSYNDELQKGITVQRRREASQRLVNRGEFTEVIE